MNPEPFQILWLIPALPLLAAACTAVLKREHRRPAAVLAVTSMAFAFALSCVALITALSLSAPGKANRWVANFNWFQIGEGWVKLGLVLDPLAAVMLMMVSFVGLLIFIYSIGYMAADENFTRFFCFLSLFASAMLGLILSNSLLLFFICWEIVGLTSYLLIGFWYQKPSAAAAAKKAFITTRIGDLAFFLGMMWLYAETGTLLFYDDGQGVLEQNALAGLVTKSTTLGLATSTGIGLLIFWGAVGKSGQVPLHVWLPDAMEGPTPVSALIHAATMVAAGVFLVARVFPLMAATPEEGGTSAVLQVITWTGAVTALFAATIAVAQNDIKRILAYSTVSQLGFMMMGLGAGGVAVGMFHLITHAFFKALLFLGAGSVIHGSHDEQDIRRMGGLRSFMPVTFITYSVGMLALSGFPLVFSGFWSKDEILHAAHSWGVSHWPFYLGIAAALLTAFYMTRQVCYVFLGEREGDFENAPSKSRKAKAAHTKAMPHETPAIMLRPLMILAACSVLLGFIGTPAWPWFQTFVAGEELRFEVENLASYEFLVVALISTAVALLGIGAGYLLYANASRVQDPLERMQPEVFRLLQRKWFVDEVYDWLIVRATWSWARACHWVERWIVTALVEGATLVVVGLAWVTRAFDEFAVNKGFDKSCSGLDNGGAWLSRFQSGNVQRYLRLIGFAVAVAALLLAWGCRAS